MLSTVDNSFAFIFLIVLMSRCFKSQSEIFVVGQGALNVSKKYFLFFFILHQLHFALVMR